MRTRPGPKPGTGTPQGERSARERYYAAKAKETELKNRQREGDLLEVTEVRDCWSRIVIAFREAVLQLPAVLVQRGHVAREREDDVTAIVHHCLRHLSERRREPWTAPEAGRR